MDLLLFVSLWLMILFSGYVAAETDEITAKRNVLELYDKNVPPPKSNIQESFFAAGISILSIRGLDESKGELVLQAAVLMVWKDSRLTPPEEMKFRFSPSEIWMPHVHILNRVEENEITLEPLVLSRPKFLVYAPRMILRTSCIPNLKYYPFDKQTCKIIMIMENEEGDLLQGNFTENSRKYSFSTDVIISKSPHWNLLSFESIMDKMVVNFGTRIDVGMFTIKIERTMPLIALTILSPSIISAILLLSTFWMKCGTSVRTGLCATSVVVSAGSLFTLGRILPVTGANTPIIAEYVSTSLILSTLSALHSILLSLLLRRQEQPPISYSTILEKIPRWILPFLVLGSTSEESIVMDEKFLYSELSESDGRTHEEPQAIHSVNSDPKTTHPWDKHIVLLDRLAFYIMGLIILLLIVSIILTE